MAGHQQRFDSTPPHQPVPRGLDGWAAMLSSLCLVHCVALPLMAVLLPSIAVLDGDTSHITHWLLLAVAAPVSVLALWRAARQHRSAGPALIAAAGFALMAGAALLHGLIEQALTVSGGLLVAAAHLRNWGLLRR
jgi:hypothetical protein